MQKPRPASLPIDVASPAAGAAALRTFFNIANAWGVGPGTQMALLGLRSRSTFNRWKESGAVALAPDTIERLSYIFGIYKALQVLLPDAASADAWMRKPNDAPLFGGRSALARLAPRRVSDLYQVRQYLDTQRGGLNYNHVTRHLASQLTLGAGSLFRHHSPSRRRPPRRPLTR